MISVLESSTLSKYSVVKLKCYSQPRSDTFTSIQSSGQAHLWGMIDTLF